VFFKIDLSIAIYENDYTDYFDYTDWKVDVIVISYLINVLRFAYCDYFLNYFFVIIKFLILNS